MPMWPMCICLRDQVYRGEELPSGVQGLAASDAKCSHARIKLSLTVILTIELTTPLQTALFFSLAIEAYQFSQPSSDFAVVMFQVVCFFSLF